ADRPALISRYRKDKPDKVSHYIEYFTPKTELATLRAGILALSIEDRSEIRLRNPICDLRNDEAPLIWKQAFWGTPRDIKLLDRLSLLPHLEDIVGKPEGTKQWLIGQGFQKEYASDTPEKLKVRPFADSHLFLDANNKRISLVLPEAECTAVGDRFRRLRRSPDQRIFQPPHVVIKQGSSGGLKVAFADFDVVFLSSIQGIHGPVQDEELLMFLAAVLDSKLAFYYLFHTAANWGTERDKVLETELLRMPFPLPETIDTPEHSGEIVHSVATLMRNAKADLEGNVLGQDFVIEDIRQQILPLVYKYYGISPLEQKLIDDTVNLWEPSSTPSSDRSDIPASLPSNEAIRTKYIALLCETLNGWARGSGSSILCSSILSERIGVGIVVLSRQQGEDKGNHSPEEKSSEHLTEVMKKLWEAIPEKQGNISRRRAFKIFIDNELYIFKPLARRYWTETYALNDADEIAAAVLQYAGRK
ncbi:hypothetical protein LC607_35570, partial [Nostoc sp. CHAB 5824]|nr:hypothetical protein [Nostoc sp. CHAB 5824]